MTDRFQPQAILFDFDGTLIDSAPCILGCFEQILHEAGITPRAPLDSSVIGPPLRQTLLNLTGISDGAVLEQLVGRFKELYDSDGYKDTRVYYGIEDMLQSLHDRRVPMAIATNKRRIPTLKILEHLGWGRYFRIVGTLDTPVPAHIDKAAMIRQVLDDIGAIAESSLYVGDKLEDGEAAQANHMRFIAAGWGYGEWHAAIIPTEWNLAYSPDEIARITK